MISLVVDLDDQPNVEWSKALQPNGILTSPEHGVLTRIGLLQHGTIEGRHTVSMCVELDNGLIVFAEQTWSNFSLAATALLSKWGNL